MTTLSRSVVDEVLAEGKTVDRSARIAQLEKQLAKVRKDIAEQERLEKRWQVFETACKKLRKEMGKTLTSEEYQAIDGLYIFLHSGCVDFIRYVPSATDKGENKRLNQDLDTMEALHELDALTK
ncbi:hypothetical protein LCGC14_1972180 [marine sediment metagenome]|uniref:Uncharacterized protein n=1 Tax=marine sediment metagenome TaxID=412755 RepID=A0A0F9FBU1_9ZZZZ